MQHPNASRPTAALPPDLSHRLRKAGLRRTLPVRAVLGALQARAPEALTHAQIMALLAARGLQVHRVTVYRLLDRLARCGVVQRHTDPDTRTWCYALVPAQSQPWSVDFACNRCGARFALAATHLDCSPVIEAARAVAVAAGHATHSAHVCLRGTCASCSQAPDAVDTTAPLPADPT